MPIKESLKKNDRIKSLSIALLSHRSHPRPRIWTRLFVNPFFHNRCRGSKVCFKARLDVFPWRKFVLGKGAIVEDWAVINNGGGDVIIGEKSRIGIGSVVVGPVVIGKSTSLGPHVHIAGFNHTFDDGTRDWNEQGLTLRPIEIGDECLIGANSCVCGGVKIGNRVQVGAGSVVAKDLPDCCVAVGNPAKVIKLFNPETGNWERV
ncbi:MAG: acyltransferase [Bacteroidaceae bacterium]|nr:acyltransferase [Bacteroidaceae bacterium]